MGHRVLKKMESENRIQIHVWEDTDWKRRCEDAAQSEGVLHPEIQRDANGKPFFSGCPELFFNVSTTRGHTVAAFAPFPVGIDWEHLGRKVASVPRIIRRYFFDEEIAWVQASPQEENARFLHLWTIKEASVKLDGCGLYEGGLCNCRAGFGEAAAPRFSFLNGKRIHLETFYIGEEFLVTVAAYRDFLLALPAKYPKLVPNILCHSKN